MVKRSVEIVDARSWQRRLAQLERLTERERKEFDRLTRLEVNVRDLRDETVGAVYAKFGAHEQGLLRLKAAGGVCPATIRNWDVGRTEFPHLTSIQRTLVACGKRLRVGDL
jgi:hypothetical protein